MIGFARSIYRWFAPMSVPALASTLLLTACAGTDSSNAYNAEPNVAKSAALSLSASLASVCSGCHGDDPTNQSIVSLNGYSALRISILFRKYKNDPKSLTTMHRMARGYTDEQIKLIARYLATESK